MHYSQRGNALRAPRPPARLRAARRGSHRARPPAGGLDPGPALLADEPGPDLVRLGAEDVLRVPGADVPVPPGDLRLELSRGPAGIAGVDHEERGLRLAGSHQDPQRVQAGAAEGVGEDALGAGGRRFGPHQQEEPGALHRPAQIHPVFPLREALELGQQPGERHPGGSVDDEPQRAPRVVFEQQHHAPRERGMGELRRRDQEAPLRGGSPGEARRERAGRRNARGRRRHGGQGHGGEPRQQAGHAQAADEAPVRRPEAGAGRLGRWRPPTGACARGPRHDPLSSPPRSRPRAARCRPHRRRSRSAR